jgi:DNA-binding transcriptional regulator YdaS (Cro superfamily)
MIDRKKVRRAIYGEFDSQSDFAQALGIHESAVSQVLRGRRVLSPEDQSKWVKVLSCDPSILESVSD